MQQILTAIKSYQFRYIILAGVILFNATAANALDEQKYINLGFTMYGAGGAASSSLCTSADGLPTDTVKQLDAAHVKDRIEALKPRYQQAEQATKVPWQLIAALHYREGSNDPNKSISNGQPLGTGTNVDGVFIPSDGNADAISAAKHFNQLAKGVYNVDIPLKAPNLTMDDLGQAFVAYNRGYIYKSAGANYDQSPYTMNGYDDKHVGMSFPQVAGEPLAGKKDANLGALTIVKYLGGINVGSSCSGNGAAQGNIVQTALTLAWTHPVAEGQSTKMDANPAYVEALKKYNDPTADRAYSDCGRFVATVMRASGADPNYPMVQGYEQALPYAQAHKDLYDVIANPSFSDFQPGDIFVTVNHSAIFTGNKPYDTVDASLGGRVPAVSNNMASYVANANKTLGGDLHIIRYKGGTK
jgi:hypothetical protein